MTITNLRDTDNLQQIKVYVAELLEKNNYTSDRPLNDGNPLLSYRRYVENVAKQLATGQGITFTALQAALKSTNLVPVGGGKLYDPSAPFGPPPFAQGFKTDTLDVPMASMNPGSERAKREDRLRKMSNGQYFTVGDNKPKFLYPDGKNIVQKIKELNLYDEDNKFNETTYIDNDSPQVDPNLEDIGVSGMKEQEGIPGVKILVPDYSAIFEKKLNGPDFGSGQQGGEFFAPKKDLINDRFNEYTRKVRAQTNFDTFFHQKDVEKGYVEQSDIEEMGALFGDDDLYVPFFVEDLRKPDRRIYFRAFLKNLRESITPEWNTETFYGRVDPVGTYRGASRTLNISFMMAAMSPAGFTAMWRKIHNFTKMAYPMRKGSLMAKAPVIRLKIGDLFANGSGTGLPGYISSPIEFDYTDMPWEISPFNGPSPGVELGKAPQVVNISFTFQVIHEEQPIIEEDYSFGFNYRRIGQPYETFVDLSEDSTTESGDPTTGESP